MLSCQEKLRLLARVFTRPMFSAIAAPGAKNLKPLSFLHEHGLTTDHPGQPLSAFFEATWVKLSRSYRNEYVYKNEIARRIVFGKHRPTTASLHVEMPVGGSIVDVAVFNGTSTAYEIKTEFDSAKRLETQTKDYAKAFEKVYVVAHPSCAQRFAGLVGPTIGVLALKRSGSLSEIKPASSNSESLDHGVMFRCLRRNEYIAGLRAHLDSIDDIPNGLVAAECMAAFCSLTLADAHILYANSLRNRRLTLQTCDFVSKLPSSLKVLGYATPLSATQQSRVHNVLSDTVNFTLAPDITGN